MATAHVYGMRVRGFGPDTCPTEGFLDAEVDPLDDYWNILVYNRKLEREEAEHFDLDYLGKRELP